MQRAPGGGVSRPVLGITLWFERILRNVMQETAVRATVVANRLLTSGAYADREVLPHGVPCGYPVGVLRVLYGHSGVRGFKGVLTELKRVTSRGSVRGTLGIPCAVRTSRGIRGTSLCL